MSKLRVIEELPERLFAIGDLHGCAAETAVLLDHLVDREGLSDRDLVVFVGDYVDRGPDSKGVIDLLIQFQQRHSNVIFLKGNHEDMLLEFLGYDGRLGHSYIVNGGAVTLQSYGLSVDQTVEEILAKWPPLHISFLLNLESYVEVGDFVVAHAGLNPLRDLRAQLDEDLFWIRDEFISNIHYFRKVVLFGHTPYQDLMFHVPYKIGLDTGLVFGNKLSCVEPITGKILQIDSGDRVVIEDTLQRRAISVPVLPEGAKPLSRTFWDVAVAVAGNDQATAQSDDNAVKDVAKEDSQAERDSHEQAGQEQSGQEQSGQEQVSPAEVDSNIASLSKNESRASAIEHKNHVELFGEVEEFSSDSE